MKTVYDIAFVGAGAAGMFAAIHSPKNLLKILIEKNEKIGKKVLLSGGERCNVSNIDIDPEKDYFGKNKKILLSVFSKFSNYDMIDWLESRGVKTHIEDRGRIILHSGKSQELLHILEQELQKNNVKTRTGFCVQSIEKQGEIFVIQSDAGEEIYAQKIVISTGGKSFAQVGTDGWGYTFAKQLGLAIVEPYKGLCGIVCKEDLKDISGTTVFLEFCLYDKQKLLYSEYGSFLFTHFGISGPLVFNGVLRLGEYLREIGICENDTHYIKENISIGLKFDSEHLTKKLRDFFHLTQEDMYRQLQVNDLRTWAEAKVTGGGVEVDVLDKNFMVKSHPGVYFIGEVLDITGKTGGYNLQSAWSQGFIVGKSL